MFQLNIFNNSVSPVQLQAKMAGTRHATNAGVLARAPATAASIIALIVIHIFVCNAVATFYIKYDNTTSPLLRSLDP